MLEGGEAAARAALIAVFLLPGLGAAAARLLPDRGAGPAPAVATALAWGAALYLLWVARAGGFEWSFWGWGWRIDLLAAGVLVMALGAALILQIYIFSVGRRRGSGVGAAPLGLLSAGGGLCFVGTGGVPVFCGLETAGLGLLWLHGVCGLRFRARLQWAVLQFGTAAVAVAYIAGPASDWAALALLAGVMALWVQMGLATRLDRRPGTAYGAAVQLSFALPVGAYFLLRWAGPLAAPPVALVSLAAGGFLLLWGGFMALQAVDARRLLASLGLAQGGYVLLAVGLGAPGVGLVHLVGAVCGLLLLGLGAGRIVHALGGRSDLAGMTGMGAYLPWTFWIVLAGGLSLAGGPPLAGFWSQGAMLLQAYNSGLLGVVVLVCLAVPLGAAAAFRLFCLAFVGPPSAAATRPLVEWPAPAAVALLPAAVCCIAASLWSYPLGDGAFLRFTAGQWPAGEAAGAGRLSVFELGLVSSGLVAIGLGLAWGRIGDQLGSARRSGFFDRSAFAWGAAVETVAFRLYAAVEVVALELVGFVSPASMAGGLARAAEKTMRLSRLHGAWWTASGAALFLAYMLWQGG